MKFKKIIASVAAATVAALNLSALTVSAEDTYHAYIGVQTASYSFRNAWDDGTYGKGVVGDDGMEYFNQITGWEGATALNKGGVFTDAEITGDGTYSVSVTDFDFGSDETLNLLFVSTDVPLDSGITFSDVKIIMDGQTKYTFDEAFLSPDSLTYAQPMAINIWNDDLGKADGLFGYMMPTDSIEIQFTVSGMAAASSDAAADEAAADEAPAADSTTTSTTTGNTAVAGIAAVMAVAGAAALVSKRK